MTFSNLECDQKMMIADVFSEKNEFFYERLLVIRSSFHQLLKEMIEQYSEIKDIMEAYYILDNHQRSLDLGIDSEYSVDIIQKFEKILDDFHQNFINMVDLDILSKADNIIPFKTK